MAINDVNSNHVEEVPLEEVPLEEVPLEEVPLEEVPHIHEANHIWHKKLYLAVQKDDCEANHIEHESLYLAALKGDRKSFENIPNTIITNRNETALHIAAVANREQLVSDLVNVMNKDYLNAKNIIENTALTYAAASGNVTLAKLIREKNSALANLGRAKPLYMAALLSHHEMVEYLSNYSTHSDWSETEQADLFVTYCDVEMYGRALKMLEDKPALATIKNKYNETALHVFAPKPSAFASGRQPGFLRSRINSWMKVKQDQNSKQAEARELLKKICAHVYISDIGNSRENEEISQLIFVAAKERHNSIFSLLNELGSIKNLILEIITDDGNNMLHLAAKLAPEHKLNAISGAALQMQQELLWFKVMTKVVRSSFKEMKNDKGKTPYDLFVEEHKPLRQTGEKWMRHTAISSMVVAALIAQIVFSGQPDDGLNHSSEKSKLVLAYSRSSAIALFSSSTSLIMFVSILISRYSFNDFHYWLPIQLMIGVTSLFISIAAMMAAFCASFSLKYHNNQEIPLLAVLFGSFACLAILYSRINVYYASMQSTFIFRSTNVITQSAIAQARPLLTLFGRAHILLVCGRLVQEGSKNYRPQRTWRARRVNSGLSYAGLSGMLEISSSMRAYYCPTANFGHGHTASQRLSDRQVWPAFDFLWDALIIADALLLRLLFLCQLCLVLFPRVFSISGFLSSFGLQV
ncbi:isoform 2 of ankyrin repeat domain-containing protein 17 [Fagus crenata]